jgi:hypothetical protein
LSAHDHLGELHAGDARVVVGLTDLRLKRLIKSEMTSRSDGESRLALKRWLRSSSRMRHSSSPTRVMISTYV